MNTDRNLLFGVLALQVDLIDTSQFAEACSAWAARKHAALSDILVERGWISATDKADVERLLERKLKRYGGDMRATLGAVAENAARSVIANAADREVSAVFRLDLTPPLPPATPHVLLENVAKASGSTPRYTLTRLHAEGGLGQVWVARDGDLNREVALKELKPGHSRHPEAWRRFLKEAQVTGQLEHPNIVPVYELARRPHDDVPFYTMKFVRGQTLRDAIRQYHGRRRQQLTSDRDACEHGRAAPREVPNQIDGSTQKPSASEPTQSADGSIAAQPMPHSANSRHPVTESESDRLELRRLLGAFASVCNAIGYAHSRGVIHRDLKPSNVVLGGFGEVIVLDWGLAKIVTPEDENAHTLGFSVPGESEATADGCVLGTPAYMSPEQAQGQLDRLDGRTDIYGLGAILFEILTGRPPHHGKDTKELLERIIHGDQPRARSVNPSVEPALDAICARAMAKSQAGRYANASDLADEVQRWLADEPIHAFREPLSARLGRWARRHKSIVNGAAAVLITAVLGLSVSTVLIEREKVHVQEQRQLALEYTQRYRGVMDRMFAREQILIELIELQLEPTRRLEPRAGSSTNNTSVSYALSNADVPVLDPTHRASLEESLAFYRELVQEERTDPLAQHESGRAHRRVAEILRALGRYKEAEGSLKRSIQLFEQLVARIPGELEHREQLAHSQNGLGVLLRTLGDYGQAGVALRSALATMERFVRASPQKSEYRRGLSDIRNNLAVLLCYQSQLSPAQDILGQALNDAQALIAESPSVPEYRLELARIQSNLGTLLALSDKPQQADESFRSALQSFDELIGQYPNRPQYLHERTNTLFSFGVLLHKTMQHQEAEAKYREALKQFEDLARDNSRVPEYRRKIAAIHFNIGLLSAQASNTAAAEQGFNDATSIQEELVAQHPEVPEYQGELATTLKELGLLRAKTLRFREAEGHWSRSEELLERVTASLPERADFRRRLASLYYSRGVLSHMTNRPEQAETAYARSIELNEKLTQELPFEASVQQELAFARTNLGNLLLSSGRGEDAEKLYRLSVASFEKLAADSPANRNYDGDLGMACTYLADLLADQGRLEEARQYFEQGLSHVQVALESNPSHPVYPQLVRGLHFSLSETLLRLGDHAAAARVADLWARSFPEHTETYKSARVMARCAGLMKADETLSTEKGTTLAQSYGDRAMELLGEAVRQGFKDGGQIERDPSFDSIRSREDFQKLLEGLRL